jgi:hypothetical protein
MRFISFFLNRDKNIHSKYKQLYFDKYKFNTFIKDIDLVTTYKDYPIQCIFPKYTLDILPILNNINDRLKIFNVVIDEMCLREFVSHGFPIVNYYPGYFNLKGILPILELQKKQKFYIDLIVRYCNSILV